MIEIRHLRSFLAVAEELHFSRAARRLRMAQPPFSQQIRDLERALGVPLLVRTTRSVALTPAGAAFRDGAQRTMAELERSIDAVKRVPADLTLRIGHTAYAAAAMLKGMLRRFHNVAPEIVVDLVEDCSSANVRSVANHDLDVAFATGPLVHELRDARLRSCVVFREPLMAAVPRGHPISAKRAASLSALAYDNLVLFPRRLAPAFYDQLMALCAEAGFDARVTRRVAGYDHIVAAVAAGGVVALVPRCLARRRDGVSFVRLKEETSVSISMVWSEPWRSRALQTFVETAIHNTPPHPPLFESTAAALGR